MRFIAADTHPDHDTIATFRRENLEAFTIAFHQVLIPATELGLLSLGMVSIDGSKVDANSSKIKSVRYDRATADAADLAEPQALPAEIAWREVLKARLDEACARLEAEAGYLEKLTVWEGRSRRGGKPKSSNEAPPPDRQSNLTAPDSKLMRKSKRHAVRQAYNG